MNKLGLQITEKEYRALPYPSYSLLSGISKEGPLVMYGTKPDISDLDSIIIGSLVDSLVTEGGPPDNMVIVNKKPSSKALAIIKALAMREDLPAKYLLSVKNEKQIKEECDSLEYYKNASTEQRIKHLKKYNVYVKALSKYGLDAMIVSSYHWDEANALANNLFVRYPFLNSSDVLGQVKILGKVNNVEIKGMLDFVHFNHTNKTIIPYDLKTGMGSHNEFFENGFLRWKYFIQASLYRVLLEQHLIGTPYEDYTVQNFRFMFCGRTDRLPIIYRVTDKWHRAGLHGFEYKGNTHPGVYELLDEYEYYVQHPNAIYRRGYDSGVVDFDDNLVTVIEDGK